MPCAMSAHDVSQGEQALGGLIDACHLRQADSLPALLGELDALERVQPRIDAWLRVSVGALSDEVQMGPVGEGPI